MISRFNFNIFLEKGGSFSSHLDKCVRMIQRNFRLYMSNSNYSEYNKNSKIFPSRNNYNYMSNSYNTFINVIPRSKICSYLSLSNNNYFTKSNIYDCTTNSLRIQRSFKRFKQIVLTSKSVKPKSIPACKITKSMSVYSIMKWVILIQRCFRKLIMKKNRMYFFHDKIAMPCYYEKSYKVSKVFKIVKCGSDAFKNKSKNKGKNNSNNFNIICNYYTKEYKNLWMLKKLRKTYDLFTNINKKKNDRNKAKCFKLLIDLSKAKLEAMNVS